MNIFQVIHPIPDNIWLFRLRWTSVDLYRLVRLFHGKNWNCNASNGNPPFWKQKRTYIHQKCQVRIFLTVGLTSSYTDAANTLIRIKSTILMIAMLNHLMSLSCTKSGLCKYRLVNNVWASDVPSSQVIYFAKRNLH